VYSETGNLVKSGWNCGHDSMDKSATTGFAASNPVCYNYDAVIEQTIY